MIGIWDVTTGLLIVLMIGTAKAMLVAFGAWWCKAHYMVVPAAKDEETMMDRASRGEGQWALLIDRATFFGWVLLWYCVMQV